MKDNISKITITKNSSPKVVGWILDCFKVYDKKPRKNVHDTSYNIEIISK